MQELLADPLVQSAGLPLTVAFAVAGLIRLIGGEQRGTALASVAVAVGFVCAYAAVLGWPPMPPVSSNQKLVYIAVVGLATGAALDFGRASKALERILVAVLPLAALIWLGWNRLKAPDPAFLGLIAVLWIGGMVVLWRVGDARGWGIASSVMMLMASLGAGGLAVLGSAASLAQLFFALAAALGGFMLWNWPKPRLPFRAAALFGAGLTWLALADAVVLYTKTPVVTFLPLLLVFFVEPLARRLPLPRSALGDALLPVAHAAIALIPVLAAVGTFMLLVEPSGY